MDFSPLSVEGLRPMGSKDDFIAFDKGERILIVSFSYEISPAGIDLDAMRFQGLDAILDWLVHGLDLMW